MRKKHTVVINGKRPVNIKRKLFIELILFIIMLVMLISTIRVKIANKKFAEQINEFYKFNSKTVFTIDKIYLYSSANAIEKKENRPIWNLNIYQYTDIAIYINNNSNTELNYENSVKSMYIDNIKISEVKKGNPNLYFKNIQDFGKSIISSKSTSNTEVSEEQNDEESQKKLVNIESEKINDRLEFTILNDGDIDYSKPEFYADCSHPITLEYLNNNIKENEIISDIKNDIVFDGSLLRKSGVILSDIECNISFRVNIINNYDQKFMANVYINIPLENTVTGDNIYNGKFVKMINETNYTKFYRVN